MSGFQNFAAGAAKRKTARFFETALCAMLIIDLLPNQFGAKDSEKFFSSLTTPRDQPVFEVTRYTWKNESVSL